MANNKKVSVIVPVFNAEKHLRKSVESVINQTYSNWELIIVNDGSTDSSPKICDEYSDNDNRIVVIHQQNFGVSMARNTGVKAATGDYVVFLDADDEFDLNLLEDNIEIIEKNEADILIFNFKHVKNGNPAENGYSLNEIFCGDNKTFFENELCRLMKFDLMNASWNKIIRRDFLVNNNIQFDELFSIFEDAMFSVKICRYAKTICINSKSYYYYYVWNHGSLRTKLSPNRFDAIKKLYELETDYCTDHGDNDKQLRCFDELFCHNLVVYMQTVSVNPELKTKEGKNMLRTVCNDVIVRQAFENYIKMEQISFKRKIIGLCLLMKMPGMILRLFRLKKSLKKS